MNLNLYPYDASVMTQVIESMAIKSKLILNAKVMYRFSHHVEVFVTLLNLIDDDEREFLYTDRIGRQIMGDLNLRL